LLGWVETQLQFVRADEVMSWAKILENLLVVVDAAKLEKATRGGWRGGVARCLLSLLTQTST
jgi:nucleolar pre-ribosomal-associated protein 1